MVSRAHSVRYFIQIDQIYLFKSHRIYGNKLPKYAEGNLLDLKFSAILFRMKGFFNQPWQDNVFTFGSLIFVLALLPTLFGEFKPSLWTSIMTGSVLAVYTYTFYSLKFWYSAGMTCLTSICWLILAIQVV